MIEEFYKKIPIIDDEGLFAMEDWLKKSDNFRIMVRELSRLGGSGVAQSTRKVLYKVLSNEIAQKYSWDGAKQKRSLKSLLVAKAILDSMKGQFQDSKETEIINIIKIWLVKAKERLKNTEKGRPENIET
ncbi:uncharacterized protein LOC115885119 [Sitophilus oryzae]|uniref:Uncharacterized protein LOC115885119 n=1 Tax=Sitophilus oryzae TaxID=7048 RepID=A0A6J2Y867_SITOR|nr:uncharacterized protein LOC115885119 [Sitophilus oryzae]